MDGEMLNTAIVDRWFTSFWGSSCDLAIVDELAAPTCNIQWMIPDGGDLL